MIAALALLAGCARVPPPAVSQGLEASRQGYAAIDAQDFPAAERALTEAARLLPDDPYVQLDLGVAEQNLGKRDAARAAYQRAITLGVKVLPKDVTDPQYAGRTVAQLAQDDLDGMDKPPEKPSEQPPVHGQTAR